jgi:hypothetical protein
MSSLTEYFVRYIRHYATSQKVAGSRPDRVNELFLIYLILTARQSLGDYSASNRNEYQKRKHVVSVE